MRLMFLLFILVVATAAIAQQPDTLWTRAYGGAGMDDAYGVCATPDGGFLIVGRTMTGSQSDFLAVRINALGDTLWTRRYGGAASEIAYSVCTTFDSAFVIAGSSTVMSNGVVTMALYKINQQGTVIWNRQIGWTSSDYAYSIEQMPDSGFMIAGTSSLAGNLNYVLVKTDPNGYSQWTQTYGTAATDYFGGAASTADGGYIYAGTTLVHGSSNPDIYVVKTNAGGDTLWTRFYGGTLNDYAYGIRQCIDGGYIIGCTTQSYGAGGQDFYLIKTDGSGNTQWTRTYGFSSTDCATGVTQCHDGGYLIAGVTDHFNGYDFYIVKTDGNGDTVWTKTVGGASTDYLKAFVNTSDGGVLAVGYTQSYGHGQDDFWAVRVAGFCGISGVVSDRISHHPLRNVFVGAVGQPNLARTDLQGHYGLNLPPGTFSIIASGPCVGRDTVRNVTVVQDSISPLSMEVYQTSGAPQQTSLNPIARNHVPSPDTLILTNNSDGVIDFVVDAYATQPQTPWLSVVPSSGSVRPLDSLAVVVWVRADTNNAGIYDYYGSLDVHMNSCPDSLWHIPVIASVLEAGEHRTVPLAFTLAASPNPFNPTTNLNFDLPQAGHVSLIVYDVSGREVEALTDKSMPAGSYRLSFDGSALPSGIYFARLTSGHAVHVAKLLLIK